MNAIQFIKDNGVDKAREVVDGQKDTVAPNLFKYFSPSLNDYHMLNIESNVRISELKRLVDSVDLIDSLGGLELSKKESNNCRFYEYADMSHRAYAIKQAIADYELINEGK